MRGISSAEQSWCKGLGVNPTEALDKGLSVQPREVSIPGPRAGGRRVQGVTGEAMEDTCLAHGPRDSDFTKEIETAYASLIIQF